MIPYMFKFKCVFILNFTKFWCFLVNLHTKCLHNLINSNIICTTTSIYDHLLLLFFLPLFFLNFGSYFLLFSNLSFSFYLISSFYFFNFSYLSFSIYSLILIALSLYFLIYSKLSRSS